jgi:hypothetical protein
MLKRAIRQALSFAKKVAFHQRRLIIGLLRYLVYARTMHIITAPVFFIYHSLSLMFFIAQNITRRTIYC